MHPFCEACEQGPVQTVEPCDDAKEPYRLCVACHRRLQAKALRPLEWYNLAKRHGWQNYLLHDDFYDQRGVASDPEEDVVDAATFPMPTLSDVAKNTGDLLDYSLSQWNLNEAVKAAWLALPRTDILLAICERLELRRSLGIRSRLLEICAWALRESAADLVRYAWGDFEAAFELPALAQASAKCLPFEEGFENVTTAINGLKGTQKLNAIWVLGYFHSASVLEWIELNVFQPITETWGYAAAASQFDWLHVEQWLERGRPLALVAIDALLGIAVPPTPLLRAYRPRLLMPPSPEQFTKVLLDYAQKDKVPRVQDRIRAILQHTETLTQRVS